MTSGAPAGAAGIGGLGGLIAAFDAVPFPACFGCIEHSWVLRPVEPRKTGLNWDSSRPAQWPVNRHPRSNPLPRRPGS